MNPLTETITWIPVAEGLPEKSGFYPVAMEGGTGLAYFDGRVEDFDCEEFVTHWAEPLRGPVLDQASPTP